jgi:hypothetical protein
MTASSPRGTFSQAELAGERVITRCITRPVSAPAATIPAMPGELEPLPAADLPGRRRAGGAGAGPGAGVADRAAVGAHPPRLRR